MSDGFLSQTGATGETPLVTLGRIIAAANAMRLTSDGESCAPLVGSKGVRDAARVVACVFWRRILDDDGRHVFPVDDRCSRGVQSGSVLRPREGEGRSP